MNAVTKFQPQPPAQPRKLNVQAVMSKLLEPVEVKREIQAFIGGMSDGWRHLYQFTDYRASARENILNRGEEWARRERDAINTYDACLPTVHMTKQWETAVRAVLDTPATEKERRLLVGMCLDSFRAKPTEGSPILFEMLMYVLAEGVEAEDGGVDKLAPISATVLAAAVEVACRTCVFPPSVKELLDLCGAERQKFRNALSLVRQLRAARCEIDAIMADPELIPPEKLPDDPNAIPF